MVQLSVLKYFLEDLHFDPNIKGPVQYESFTLCQFKWTVAFIIKYLIENQYINPMTRSSLDDTALQIESFYGELPSVKYFIEILHQDPFIRGMSNWTLLHSASEGGHLDVVKYLVEIHHLDPLIPDTNNDTCLHIAARNGKLNILKCFIHDQEYSPKVKGHKWLHYSTYGM